MPGTIFDVIGDKKIGFGCGLGGKGHIIPFLILVITQTGSPGTIGIIALSVFEGTGVVLFQIIIHVVYDLPVHQIIGAHDRCPRRHMHRRTDHIIRIPNPYNILIRYIRKYDGIGKGTISTIRSKRPHGISSPGKADA